MRRLAQPEEIAYGALYLASDESCLRYRYRFTD